MPGIAPADRSTVRIVSANRTRPSVLLVIHDIQCRSEAQGSVSIFVPDVSGAITFWWSVSLQNPYILLFLYYIGRFWAIFWRCQTFHSKDYRVGARRLFSSYLEPLCPGCFSEGLSVPEKKSSNKNRCFHTPTLKSFWTEVIC